jgi:hypothetical protein
MVYAVGASVNPLDFGSDCSGSDCDTATSRLGGAVGGGLGVDLIFGTSRTNRGRFLLGLRGGRIALLGDADGEHWPLAQLNFGVTF